MKKIVVGVFLFVFGIVLNVIAFFMWRQGVHEGRVAEIVDGSSPGTYSASEPFVAEGVLDSSSGGVLKSLHLGQECLAFRTVVRWNYTETDSDGELEDRHNTLMDEKKQVPDLKITFSDGEATLDILKMERFFGSHFEELDFIPDYVPDDKLPKKKIKGSWFDVTETAFKQGDKVTVVGLSNDVGVLLPHPVAEELIIFPGNRAQCAQALDDSGRSYYIAAAILVGMSIFGVLLVTLILRFTKD